MRQRLKEHSKVSIHPGASSSKKKKKSKAFNETHQEKNRGDSNK